MALDTEEEMSACSMKILTCPMKISKVSAKERVQSILCLNVPLRFPWLPKMCKSNLVTRIKNSGVTTSFKHLL